MVEADENSPNRQRPLVLRIPVQIPALLLPVVCVCSFVAIYLDVSPTARGVLAAVGLGLFVTAVTCLRMALEVDADGLAVRHLLGWRRIAWSQVERVEIASGIKGSESIRVVGRDGALIDVPPALVQPTFPTGRPRAQAQLRGTLAEIQSRRPGWFRP